MKNDKSKDSQALFLTYKIYCKFVFDFTILFC